MLESNSSKKQTDKLRERAEDLIYQNDFTEDFGRFETEALLHELQVNRIELELQNEELKDANIQSEDSLAKYFSLYDLSPIGYFTINEKGKILEVNQAGAELFKVINRNLIHNFFQNFIVKENLINFEIFLKKVLNSGTKQSFDTKMLINGKPLIYVQITGIAVKPPNKDFNMIWLSLSDITERIEAEEAKAVAIKQHFEESQKLVAQMQEFDKLKTEYLVNISHELRTPLSVILSTLKLLQLKKSKSEENYLSDLDKHLKIITQNGYRLLKLVNNLIDIGKFESGFYEMNLINCDIVSTVKNIALSVAEYVEDRGSNLTFDTDIEGKIIACDPDMIERILLNLLSNAIKYTKPGDNIFVNVFDRGDSIEISVRDTGIGIPKDKQELIFQRFRQIDTSLSRDHEGSGIGLSLVKSLVEMHKGTISLESEYGKGCKFIVRLPVNTMDEKDSNGNVNKNTKQIQTLVEKLNIEFSDIYK